MIVIINPILLNSANAEFHEILARILNLYLEGKFIWDINNIDEIFIGEIDFRQTELYKKYLSENSKERIEEIIQEVYEKEVYQTKIQKEHLTTINIGLGPSDVNPLQAYDILNIESRVVVENSVNDWKFFSSLVKKYSVTGSRNSIYKMIDIAISKHLLVPENAGGVTGIPRILDQLSNQRYNGIEKYKIFALFDSDRRDNQSLRSEQAQIISWIKRKAVTVFEDTPHDPSDRIFWHMLYKYSIENYLPIKIYRDENVLPEALMGTIEALEPDTFDFYKFDTDYLWRQKIDIKEVVPNQFEKKWPQELIENRCEHHKVKIELSNGTLTDVSEIEELLLKIAKII